MQISDFLLPVHSVDDDGKYESSNWNAASNGWYDG